MRLYYLTLFVSLTPNVQACFDNDCFCVDDNGVFYNFYMQKHPELNCQQAIAQAKAEFANERDFYSEISELKRRQATLRSEARQGNPTFYEECIDGVCTTQLLYLKLQQDIESLRIQFQESLNRKVREVHAKVRAQWEESERRREYRASLEQLEKETGYQQ